ncbi:flagellar hook-basal body complex protein [Thiovibrio frasassiensis]|uniref:Flagellar hook protein FlgE n=1 Tax=Thiovibrio frasassiensis TaxID=2984131 RepID=A0A9X4MGW1_9BACT|nr:flagellar hook-basal body complex protein [Thiovibrio frasassiensis]MDG4477016.1 flagellar hook-basal body complex protein [Thiovibrio frasassiensis]
MELLASFYNGLSGVNAMGQKLNVTANNVANVNTNAFKSGQTLFADVFETTLGSLSFGHGVQLGQLGTSFTSGMLETTGKATDMAISGPGFFMVRRDDATTPDTYTRSGNFKLVDHLGTEPNAYNLVTPTGQFVQGYNLSASTGSPTTVSDILVKSIAPQSATSAVQLVLNLQNNPALVEPAASPVSLFDSWNGTNTAQPIATSNYDYKTSLKIYGPGDESAGFSTPSDTYDLTVYFDATANPNEQEFLVTCNPALDQRLSTSGTSYTNTQGAGALLYGVLSFSNNGALNNIQCWNVPPDGNVDPTTPANLLTLARGESYYSFDFNFTGTPANNSSTLSFGNTPKPQSVVSPAAAFSSATTSSLVSATSPWSTVSDALGNTVQVGDTITLQGTTGDGTAAAYSYTVDATETVADFLTGLENQFACTASIVNGQLTLTDTEVGASQLAISSLTHTNAGGATPLTDPTIAQIFGDQSASFTASLGDLYQTSGLTTTNYASSSSMLYQSQNGYGKGRLQDISVDSQGFVTGQYSNGQNITQAQLVLANFMNLQGLRNMGDNNFVATDEAGIAMIGTAGDSSFGTASNYTLESSNVDLGREMVDVITTQRAFQANAKSLSTADDMYEKLIQMIR